MAGRVLNRRELRKQTDAAEGAAPAEAEAGVEVAAPPKKRKAKPPGAPKVRKPRKKKDPVRMCAHWGVFDATMKRLALFDYNQRADADQKVADLKAKKNGEFFLQIVKEPMPVPEPADGSPA